MEVGASGPGIFGGPFSAHFCANFVIFDALSKILAAPRKWVPPRVFFPVESCVTRVKEVLLHLLRTEKSRNPAILEFGSKSGAIYR